MPLRLFSREPTGTPFSAGRLLFIVLGGLSVLLISAVALALLGAVAYMMVDVAGRMSSGEPVEAESFWMALVLFTLTTAFFSWLLYLVFKKQSPASGPSPASLRVLGTVFAVLCAANATGFLGYEASMASAIGAGFFSALCFRAAGKPSNRSSAGQRPDG